MYAARIILLVLIFPALIQAQGIKIGIDWNTPANNDSFRSELNAFHELGISIIQIEGVLPLQQLQILNEFDFEVWVSSGLKFTRKFEFRNISALIEAVTDPIFYYKSNGLDFSRYTLVEQPQVFTGLSDSLQILAHAAGNVYDGMLDILTHTNITLHGFDDVQISRTLRNAEMINDTSLTSSYMYLTTPFLKDNPAYILRDIWSNKSLNSNIFIFNSVDFFNLSNSDPDFLPLLRAYTQDRNSVIALTRTRADPSAHSTSAAILLLIGLMIFISIIMSNAGYQRSITRFTITHNFYVNDVMMRRIRAGGDVLFSWIMTFVFGSILFHAMVSATYNEITREMVATHHPVIHFILNSGTIAQLFASVFVMIAIQLLTYIWILISVRLRIRPSQILQLYLIPQQLIVIFTILALLIFLNSGNGNYLILFTGLNYLMVLFAFPIIAVDIAKYLQKRKAFFILSGPLLYIITILAILIWLFTSTSAIDSIILYLQIANS